MKKQIQNAVLIVLLLFSPTVIFSQTLDPGILSTFEAFTGMGAVVIDGQITGDVGTDSGAISGTGLDSTYTGMQYNNDSITDLDKIAMLRMYIHLSNVFVTYPGTHAAAFGNGDTITPGVYSIASSGSLAGTLTLDGGGNTNAFFIMKFDEEFTAGAGSNIILSGGTRACNVYWVAEGAISVASNSSIKGTLFSHPGAISIGTNCQIEGRLLASEGAITLGDSCVAFAPSGVSSIPIKCSSGRDPAAAVDVLGSIEGFAMFSSSGAVSNATISGFVGHIGSNAGIISGFASSVLIGEFYNADSVTAQAKIDLDSAYIKLTAIPKTDSTHAASFGGGDTLTAGVYYIAGSGSLAGTLTLDGGGNPDAIFIIRFNGAFSVTAQSKVIFTNGTRLCNVFWIAEGAVSMGAFTYMKGTVLAHDFACSMAANGNLEGRMLSTSGAVSFSTGAIYYNLICHLTLSPLPIQVLSFTAEVEDGHVQLDWITTAEINNDYFNVEQSVDGINFTSISRIKGAGNSTQALSYSIVHYTTVEGRLYYRLKQTDFDGNTSYSKIVAVEFKNNKDVILDIYPNPFSGETTFHTSKNLIDASLIVCNPQGVVKQIENISGRTFSFQRENLRSGLYWVKVVQDDKVVAIKKVVVTN